MLTKDEALQKIQTLVERFDEQFGFYKHTDYNETQTRRDFIDPFWKALGWDVDNENGYAESYREVIHEDRVKVAGATKAPDYSFRLVGGKRLFFLEAKKPSVNIKDDVLPAYQVRRYGWSAKLPISVISDFEEFAIYDCLNKPKPNDKASTGRIKYLTYQEYISDFDFIWDTFSKERVLKGSFDKYIQSDKNKRGTTSVDKEFLASLDEWRKALALNIALRNKNLSFDEYQLNYIVQNTLDRFIFLRIAEDRGVELYGKLQSTISSGNYYQNLLANFYEADQKYNSGLFDFKKDNFASQIVIDNKVVKEIINELYYPASPYEFSVLSVEILGSAYEQFLGKQIVLSKSGRATIEEKPEVRKAGGVYYTPQYIVDYIVKNTLGKLLIGKEPAEISKLKIVDPACGSGSFLIGAYQYLLDWHKDFYIEYGKSSKGEIDNPLTPIGDLTTNEKKRILTNNIFGVDLDSNAVEVTKLSLLLKCMEGETKESIESQTILFHKRVLPSLDDNIKSGNSLIDLDFYDNEIDFGDERKIKPFSWQKAFPEVFNQGGFDAVIGNPPYVQPVLLDKESQDYLLIKYSSNNDLYSMFIEKSIRLIKDGGNLGFIIPSLFIKGVKYHNLRDFINGNSSDFLLYEKGDNIFENVKMPTCIILLLKGENLENIDYFKNNFTYLFTKVETIKLETISNTRRGLEIGRNKLIDSSTIKCIGGSNIDSYLIKSYKFISEVTFNSYNKKGNIFTSPKLLIRETGNKFFATIDYDNIVTTRSIYNTKIISLKFSPEFILGIINSTLFRFYFKQFISPETNIFPKIRISQLNELPIPKNFEQNIKTQIEKLVNQIIELKKNMMQDITPNYKEQLSQRIAYTEDKIDKLVYQLYDLNEDEIRIIENG